MQLSERDCLDIAIMLVEQRDEPGLVATMKSILENQLADCQVELHHIIPGSEPVTDETLRQCVEQRSPVTGEDGRYLHPVILLGRVGQVFDIRGPAVADKLALLERVFTLFNNQHVLLENNNHDALTGLLNRQAFDTRINAAVENRRRGDHDGQQAPDCCFALLDIDHFKMVNDNYGHLYGDEVLILLANLMEDSFRHEDMLFRYGGEEFALLLRNISLDQATTVLDRFRSNVEANDFPQIGTVTLSIGVTSFSSGLNRFDLVSRADQALYYSKQHGRNQVNSYEQLITDGKMIPAAPAEEDIELF